MAIQSKFTRILLMSSAACLAAPTLVWAAAPAPAAAPAANSGVGDIVVTATRREERLQDVPIADTAVSGKRLDQKQISDVVTLAYAVPSMTTHPTLSPLEITVAIRGVTEVTPSLTFDPPIGIYVDGVYTALNAGSNAALVDMERVEVLKGPQGTLFGRNTIGGAISIVTKKPIDEFEGYVQADAGDYAAMGVTAMANVPIKPGMLDARLVYQHMQHGGYGTDFTTNTPNNTRNQDYLRGTVKFDPNSTWDVLVTGFYTHAYGFGSASALTYMSTTNPFNALVPHLSALHGNPYAISHPGDLLTNYISAGTSQDSYGNVPNTYALNEYGVTGTVTGHLNDLVSVKSITGYAHTDYNTAADIDGTPYSVTGVTKYPIHVDQISEELQAYGNAFDGRLTWIAGGYFFSETGSQVLTLAAVPDLFGTAAASYTNTEDEGPTVDNKSYSVFAQATYELFPKVRLTGGVRYVIDDRQVTWNDHNSTATQPFFNCALASAVNLSTGALGTDPAACSYRRSVQYSYVPWTAGIDYRPNADTLLYAKVSQGYRAGAYSLTGPQASVPKSASPTDITKALVDDAAKLVAADPVAPESLFSPEIGAKFEFFDHKLRLNVAGYYSKYSNIQVQENTSPAGGSGANVTTLINSGTADIWGGEVEATALLGDLELDGSFGYVSPKYVSGLLVGQPVQRVSNYTATITGTYPIRTSAGVLTLTGTYAYVSSQIMTANTICTIATPCTDATAAVINAAITQPGYGVLNARASFQFANAPITLSIYGQNLTNTKYRVEAGSFAGLNFTTTYVGTPLTFGGSVKVSF